MWRMVEKIICIIGRSEIYILRKTCKTKKDVWGYGISL